MDATRYINSQRKKINDVVESCFVEYCDIPQAQIHLLLMKEAADIIDLELQNLGDISQMALDTTGS